VIADRFAQDAGGWLDLATGARIRLRVIEGGTRAAQVAWSAQCEVLATLRHPAAAPLLDFGAIGDRLFEAYATGPAPASSAKRSESVLAHAAQFLRHHRILLTGPQAEYLLRPRVIGGRDPRGRPLGIVLQRRPALDAIADALEGAAPTGPCVIRVVGPPHSGLRTLRTLDTATIIDSVRRTHRAVIIDEGWRSGSISAEIMARIMEHAFYELDAPVARVCSAEVPMPYPKHLEDAAIPQVPGIVAAARRVVTGHE